MPARQIILFDVMGTLVTEPFSTVIPGFFQMSLDELREAKHPTAWIEFEEGRLTEADYVARFFRDGRPVDADALRACVHDAYCWIDGMQDLLVDLKAAGCEMHALSNYPAWYQLIDEKLQLSRFLDWTFVSCKTGVRKPDPQAFLGAAATLEVDPQQCLFIDDRPVNVNAAQLVGMVAILYHSAEQLREELADRGSTANF
jgi:HAD superfamily hydrolase (TIGR01509 family)